jgi:hypothetical protein
MVLILRIPHTFLPRLCIVNLLALKSINAYECIVNRSNENLQATFIVYIAVG